MSRFAPPARDERSALLGFLQHQREALGFTVFGLTDERAWSVPSASELPLAGLLKHAASTERRWVLAALAGQELPGLWPITDPDAEFQRAEGDTVDALLADYQKAAAQTEAAVAALPSLDVPCAYPQAAQWSARWVLLHLIEETARHAGHADVIRQSLDGAHSWELMAKAEGDG